VKYKFLPDATGWPTLVRVPGNGAPRLPRLPKIRRSSAGPVDRLALTEVRGHLALTASTVTAWYTLNPYVWPFRADARREALLDAVAKQYAGLAGMRLHLRRTSVPFPVDQWARALQDNASPLPDQPGIAGTWQQHLAGAATRLDQGGYEHGRTHLGVTFARPGRLRRRGGELDEALAKRIAQVTEELAGHGLDARPSTSEHLAWLIYRSVGIGLTPPTFRAGDVGPEDVGEFIENVDFARGPYASTTQLTDRRTGRTVHVAVLTVGRMDQLEIPQLHDPWAHLSEQLGFPVEWSSRVEILGPAASHGSLEHRLRMIRSQQRDYADHGVDAPPELERLADRALEVGDEITTRLPVDSSRVHGWHRLAVHDETAEGCLSKARELARLYDSVAHTVLVHPKDQWRLFREFIPGEPAADTGHVRRLPVKLWAAALPQATATVGDNRGDWIGCTATSGRHPVFWDAHFPMEVRERSGLAVFVAEPGGGKSTLMGALGYLAARRGVQVTLMDPSGPLANLCRMPELRRYAQVVDLVGSQQGTLAPYALVPTPSRADYPDGPAGEAEYESDVIMSRAERKALVGDITQMLLPVQALDSGDAVYALHEALRAVPTEESSTLDDVVAELARIGDGGNLSAKIAAAELADKAHLPLGRCFFGSPPPGALNTSAAFTVITMAGLQLPDPSTDRRHWSMQQTLAVPMLHLAHRLAVRRCYGGRRGRRKFVGLDEVHFMHGWESGRAFLVRLARDSRKWNIAAGAASQNPSDILGLDVQNLVSTVFVGRIADDERIAAEALRLLQVPAGAGYEAVLAGLSQQTDSTSNQRLGFREFVMRDVDGRVQKIRVDVSYVEGLLEFLDTTPGGTR
jgi:hypothetical protein